MDDLFPFPVPQAPVSLDVRTVRINEYEGIIELVVLTDASYTVRDNDRFIVVSDTATITLPSVNTGKVFTIKSTTANTVTIDGGDYNIDGSATDTITTQYDSISVLFNGTEWSKI